jgi:hypothetical protein
MPTLGQMLPLQTVLFVNAADTSQNVQNMTQQAMMMLVVRGWSMGLERKSITLVGR